MKRREEEQQEQIIRDLERDMQVQRKQKKSVSPPTVVKQSSCTIEPPNLKILNVSRSSSSMVEQHPEWKPDNFLVKPVLVPAPTPPKLLVKDHPDSRCEEMMRKQQKEWEELKRRQEEEEMQMILQMERDLQKERQVQQSREKERLEALEIMRVKEEEARLKKVQDDMNENKMRNERIAAMSISEEEEDPAEENNNIKADEILKLKQEEEAEKLRLQEIEAQKRELEDELEREKMHLEELQKLEMESLLKKPKKPKAVEQYELMTATAAAARKSPSPGVKRVAAASPSFEAVEKERNIELQKIMELKALEQQKLKELAEIRKSGDGTKNQTTVQQAPPPSPPVDNSTLLLASAPHTKALPPLPIPKAVKKIKVQGVLERTSSESEEEMFYGGLSEAPEETSIGIDLPANDQSSGNVTPIPTTGELEDISTEEIASQESFLTPPRTPLKSLLKKPSIEEEFPPPSLSDVEDPDSRSSPPKKVHFSEINQVKLMSQESLVSTAPSEADSSVGGHQLPELPFPKSKN